MARSLAAARYTCAANDPLCQIEPEATAGTIDAIILCEVIEHVRDLPHELVTIKRLSPLFGTIIIRMRLYSSLDEFSGCWYKNDLTHINFFSMRAIEAVAERLGRKVEAVDRVIFVLGFLISG